jgi:hypothetical protein
MELQAQVQRLKTQASNKKPSTLGVHHTKDRAHRKSRAKSQVFRPLAAIVPSLSLSAPVPDIVLVDLLKDPEYIKNVTLANLTQHLPQPLSTTKRAELDTGYVLAAKHPDRELAKFAAARMRIVLGPDAQLPAGSFAAGGDFSLNHAKDPVSDTRQHEHAEKG